MAEHAAHLTAALDVVRPSIFEVVAQDSLVSTLRPAVQHAVRVLAESRPEKFGWLLRWYDELFAALDLLVEHHYLLRYSASFAENFYDLKRVPSGNDAVEHLSKRLRWKSLIFLVLVPYLKNKLDKFFEDLKYREDELPRRSGVSLQVRFYKAFLAIYPYVHMFWEGAALWHMLAYAFGRTKWHSLLLRLSGTELRHQTEIHGQDAAEITADKAWGEASSSSLLRTITKIILHGTATALSMGLSVSVFFLQFLEWWYESDASAPSLTALPIPHPPQRDSVQATKPHLCPICGRVRSNETALAVSGYVFCFVCIHEYVKTHGCCPVTGFPAKTEHIIKIYMPDS